jgi:hypothetical protein
MLQCYNDGYNSYFCRVVLSAIPVQIWRTSTALQAAPLTDPNVLLLVMLLLLPHDCYCCRHVLKMLGPRTKGSAALARAATLLQRRDDLSQLLASTLKLPPEHCE